MAWCLAGLALVAFTAQPTAAQALSGLLPGQKPTAVPSAPADPLKRTTPRSAIYALLEACHGGNLTLASQYLDLRKIPADQRGTAGPERAKELCSILDRDPQFEVDQLSNSPQGNLQDSLAPDTENLATFHLKGQTITLQMQRVSLQGVSVWLVSGDSVLRIPQLNALAGESAFEKKLPEWLVSITFIGTPLWTWIALVLLALLLSLVSRLLSRIVIVIATPIVKRYAKSLQAYRLEAFTEPLRLLLSVAVFRACMEILAPSALLRTYLLNLMALLIVLGLASLVMRIVDVISDRVTSRLDPRQRALSYSVIPLFVRFVKICLFCIAILIVLERWGYPTSTIIAGVGVGGLAIALAAQKTIENLFGSVSVIMDRPVLVGDFCKFGSQLGTVEDIGLRSTRLRTLDRTLVTIPNSVFSTMTLENYARRDRMWFHPTLQLRRDTTPQQIGQMMDAVKAILEENPKVNAGGVPVRFVNIAEQSFDLEIFAYVLTADGDEFVKIQTELLLKILDAAAKLGVGFAVPIQESLPSAHDEH
ncbi:MAG TPA: mechanosensitive ion channel family protein [Bryobacteraceae bacterium]|nr:mechanosensitive ion channel family protein [Bryobacteraceae bacterium]